MILDLLACIHILGWLQLSVIALCLLLFVAPFTFFRKYYPNEPQLRITQLGFPSGSSVAFLMHVHSTVLHDRWYVKSISEYVGPRGTTASKIMSAITSIVGTLQIVLALLVFAYEKGGNNGTSGNSSSEGGSEAIAQLVLLCLGGAMGIFVGIAESTLPWKYGREAKIHAQWRDADLATKREMLSEAIRELPQYSETNSGSSTSSNLINFDYLSMQLQSCLHSLPLVTATPSSAPAIATAFDFNQGNNNNNNSSVARTAITNKDETKNDEKKDDRKEDTKLNQANTAITKPELDRPPQAYLDYAVLRAQHREQTEHNNSYRQVLEINDSAVKDEYNAIHMAVALGLVFFNSIAFFLNAPTQSSTANLVAFLCALIGLSIFVVFSIMQYVSGNYDDGLAILKRYTCKGLLPHGMLSASCCPSLRCNQQEPEHYPANCSRQTLGRVFIAVEILGFGLLVLSLSLKSIILS
jgi:hypothetical protein